MVGGGGGGFIGLDYMLVVQFNSYTVCAGEAVVMIRA